MVYIDTPRKWKGLSKVYWCHMTADSIEEMHVFAYRIDVKRGWFQNKKGKTRPHYDLSGYRIAVALDRGAKLLSNREFIIKMNEIYGNQQKTAAI